MGLLWLYLYYGGTAFVNYAASELCCHYCFKQTGARLASVHPTGLQPKRSFSSAPYCIRHRSFGRNVQLKQFFILWKRFSLPVAETCYCVFRYISNKMQRYTVYYIWKTALHVSGGTSTHHQERKQLYLQQLVFVTPLLLPAATAAGSSNGVTKARCCRCSCMRS